MKNVRANARFWLAGICAAFLGILLARLVAPRLDIPLRAFVALGGQLIALGGLLVICIGVRRRVRSAAVVEETPPHPAGTAF